MDTDRSGKGRGVNGVFIHGKDVRSLLGVPFPTIRRQCGANTVGQAFRPPFFQVDANQSNGNIGNNRFIPFDCLRHRDGSAANIPDTGMDM